MELPTGVTVCTMVMFIITSACGVLLELLETVPDSTPNWFQGAILVGWGVFTVVAIAFAASGFSPSLVL